MSDKDQDLRDLVATAIDAFLACEVISDPSMSVDEGDQQLREAIWALDEYVSQEEVAQ